MHVVIYPGFAELIIYINPPDDFILEEPPSVTMPSLYAPWLEARGKGNIKLEIQGDTLRALLTELSNQYRKVNADFEPIDLSTNDVDFDYDIFVNGKNYVSLPYGLDAKLKQGDEVKVKMMWRWDG
jgi:molybdopterin converting factor small subunit